MNIKEKQMENRHKLKQTLFIGLLTLFMGTSCLTVDYTNEDSNILADVNWSFFDDNYLKTLKEKYKLTELVADYGTELEKIIKVTTWVTELWDHDGSNTPEQDDPIYILDQVTEQGERFRCVEYATVLYGCLQALDITSREIGLSTANVETRKSGAGHVATEAYLSDYEK